VPNSGRANYGCLDGPSGCASLSALVPAGSKPNGAGRWGHNDLAGSVWEWVLDLYQTPYPATRTDGAVVIQTQQLFLRVFRSSNFGAAASELPIAIRQNEEPTARGAYLGLRCARPSSP
jgi:formylglycine-generating enzyme required for sulfatase activity